MDVFRHVRHDSLEERLWEVLNQDRVGVPPASLDEHVRQDHPESRIPRVVPRPHVGCPIQGCGIRVRGHVDVVDNPGQSAAHVSADAVLLIVRRGIVRIVIVLVVVSVRV